MLTSVFTKTIRDRYLGVIIGIAATVLTAGLGIAVYVDLDEVVAELWGSMPEAMLRVMGMTPTAGAAGVVLGEMVGFFAPLVLGGLAISIGTSAIAGEEREGTLGVLLANPKSRTAVLLSKTGALVTLSVFGGLLTWGGMELAMSLAGASTEDLFIGGATVHVVAVALFFGAFALILGSWSGNTTVSSGASVGLMIVSFLGAGLLPLIEGWEELARIFPWYYVSHSLPLINDTNWGHVGILLAVTVVLIAGAVVLVRRRDLKDGERSETLLDRIRSHQMVAKLAERVSGQAQVANIWVKTLSDSQGVTVVGSSILFFMALVIGPMYNALSDALGDLADVFPEAILAVVGYADMSTAEGWLWAEMFSITVPAAMIAVTVMMGVRALAGEERARTMDLLATLPIKRSSIVLNKAATMVVVASILGLATFLGTAGGAVVGSLDVSIGDIAAASLLATSLALVFGMVALLAGAATGKGRVAAYGASGVTFVAWVINSFFPLSDALAGWVRLSPFHYYQDNEPLINGIGWGDLSVLIAISLVLVALSTVAFQRRDLRG